MEPYPIAVIGYENDFRGFIDYFRDNQRDKFLHIRPGSRSWEGRCFSDVLVVGIANGNLYRDRQIDETYHHCISRVRKQEEQVMNDLTIKVDGGFHPTFSKHLYFGLGGVIPKGVKCLEILYDDGSIHKEKNLKATNDILIKKFKSAAEKYLKNFS
jgi:hypothetical protein